MRNSVSIFNYSIHGQHNLINLVQILTCKIWEIFVNTNRYLKLDNTVCSVFYGKQKSKPKQEPELKEVAKRENVSCLLVCSVHAQFMFSSFKNSFENSFKVNLKIHLKIHFKIHLKIHFGLGSWSLHNLLPIHFYVHFIWKIILAFVFSSFSFHVHSH